MRLIVVLVATLESTTHDDFQSSSGGKVSRSASDFERFFGRVSEEVPSA